MELLSVTNFDDESQESSADEQEFCLVPKLLSADSAESSRSESDENHGDEEENAVTLPRQTLTTERLQQLSVFLMAFASCGAAERQAPALPVKQHRCSSLSSDGVLLSSENDAVFSDASNCHAPQCPIHQRYDASKHEMRFLSEGTPPPIPRKRLTRTLSLPGSGASSLSPPWSPLQRRHLNLDNPLYMMAPIPDSCFHGEGEGFAPAAGSTVTSPSFSQLSLDTPDEHLCALFQNFLDQNVISQGLQHRRLLFLRSTAQTVEAQWLQSSVAEGHVGTLGPWDLLNGQTNEPKRVGDQTFYNRLHSSRVLRLRVCSPKPEASPAQTQRTSPHANVHDVTVCFQPATVLTESSSLTLHPAASTGHCSVPSPPAEGSSENPRTVQSFLQGGFGVSIERSLPLATLEDFVQGSLEPPSSSDYCRQACVLLLQILMGLQHLHSNSAAAAELKPSEIFLVWQRRRDGERNQAIRAVNEQSRGIQMLWKTFGSPRVVLTPKSSLVAEPLVYIKHQVGALIHFCLLPLESAAAVSPGPASCTFYHRGLLHLSSLLQREADLQMTNTAAMLQVLLWGPQLLPLSTITVHHWLTTKQALLVIRMAEAGLKQEQPFLDWEDCMRLRFLTFADPEMVAGVAARLWDSLNKEAQV